MRLTTYIRQAFVDAAMADVPKIDYETQVEKVLLKIAVDVMPPKMRTAWADKDCKPWFNGANVYIREMGRGFNMPIGDEDGWNWLGNRSDEQKAEVQVLLDAHVAQETKLQELRSKLSGTAASVTTRKALVELLPEFEKYLPADQEKSTNLPAVANLLTEFVQAGWPKDKPKIGAKTKAKA